MKIDVDVKKVLEEQGGLTVKELKEFAVWPANIKPAHLTVSRFDTEERTRAMIARMGIMAVSKGFAAIELSHDAFSCEELDALTEIVEETLVGARVYMARGKGLILLDKVFA